MANIFRSLSLFEIERLEAQGCSSLDWSLISVSDKFDVQYIKNSFFAGDVQIGTVGNFVQFGNSIRKAGIFNSNIVDSIIGDNCFINNVSGQICGVNVGNDVVIDSCYLVENKGVSSFGNGVRVSVLNEAGGREVTIFDELSSQLAYVLAFYRYKDKVIQNLESLIEKYTASKKSTRATIGSRAILRNCSQIISVNVGEGAQLTSVEYLHNGTINSTLQNYATIGSGVVMKNFIVSKGTIIIEGSNVNNAFVGEATVLAKSYSVEESIFCSNGQFYNGEACAVFAGPHTVTHHKSTLLIGGAFSFFNAGSGTNQSNHLYKIGPVHQGVTERGVKTGSDSYVLWPAHIGCFTVVLGRHYNHPDIPELPFSYLIEKDDNSVLIPGLNFKTIGTYRDLSKWEKRDMRSVTSNDIVDYEFPNWFIIGKLQRGLEILSSLKSSKDTPQYTYNGVVMSAGSVAGGIKIYKQALNYYIGLKLMALNESFSQLVEESDLTDLGSIEYPYLIDVAGMFSDRKKLFNALDLSSSAESIEIVSKNISNSRFSISDQNEMLLLKKYIADCNYLGSDWHGKVSLFLLDYAESIKSIHSGILADAKKEFNAISGVGFGIDGVQRDRMLDFTAVRGEFESQKEFVALRTSELSLLEKVEGFLELLENKKS